MVVLTEDGGGKSVPIPIPRDPVKATSCDRVDGVRVLDLDGFLLDFIGDGAREELGKRGDLLRRAYLSLVQVGNASCSIYAPCIVSCQQQSIHRNISSRVRRGFNPFFWLSVGGGAGKTHFSARVKQGTSLAVTTSFDRFSTPFSRPQ